jgi:hypothetical protein
VIVKSEKTRAVPEAVTAFMLSLALFLMIGMLFGRIKGVYVASAAYTIAHLAQGFWLWLRSRKERATLLAIEEI